jgi:DNA-directed RNA polymerase subunit RPC12/RpoP
MTTWFCSECGHRTEELYGEYVRVICPYCIEEMEVEDGDNE